MAFPCYQLNLERTIVVACSDVYNNNSDRVYTNSTQGLLTVDKVQVTQCKISFWKCCYSVVGIYYYVREVFKCTRKIYPPSKIGDVGVSQNC